ncbi:valine--tRNA ligase [Sphingomonas sp. CGMCC 1.13654]|uniref:Valine--tRNA ligase n=1 Tax=Sphingomonas chungangi TaxID=2683589 RepID=A0A838L841_9SPHN|nr:valine--tRNA ligase [Sphingomonas chungangi]MBA2935643.1 valine--tRNA ligase [Sphingomonas chungangi]MVW54334.1 valine--tRNA ligase [Sphingomonas chungangi]
MTELPKTFDPAAIESRWYSHWEEGGLFRPERPNAEPFTIVIPPPNVTGSLHIGHALDNTLQDILVRHARLKGKDALWVVGTDHAGIATQMVVERQMNARQEKRTDYSREQFADKVWEWKAESGGTITRQLRRLGASCDWANERFTMDEGFSKAVIHVFVKLYEQGLLYRDKRLVNWDPGLKTAISDLEVETKEVAGKFWHLRYPLEDGSGFIAVATTRPETMLADMAVAVHPTDERYTALIGKKVRLPITGRLIPIVADEHADPELGSGAVKITPGHDFNDFEVGKRAGFVASEMLNMLDAEARVIQTADGLIPADLLGLDRFEARRLIVERLEADGTLTDVEDRTIATPFGDRSGVVIEPWLTDQWYVDAKTLAAGPIEAVRDGRIKVVPETWSKTWFNWLENIQPWCVSRQLWWGHRIPAWYDEDGNVYVAATEAEAKDKAGPQRALTRDEDVLDTWFSSALWPFGTLGWPDVDPRELGRYPNDILISGFDILFFWDARMAMQGMHFLADVPFKTLYLHGLVRDATGAKMSKSKGNTVDPLGLIDRYGADALRFTLAAMESQGRDIKLNEQRVEGYRNFATKLWNAARFLQANGVGPSTSLEAPSAEAPVNRWIIAETIQTVQALDLALADLRFDEAANTIYQFVWSRFCDWYIELTKGQVDEETKLVAGWAFDQILVMLHPFMPFITEELWHSGGRDSDIITARWPQADAKSLDPEAAREIDWLIRLVSEIRAARAELNVPPGAMLEVSTWEAGDTTLKRLSNHLGTLRRLAKVHGFYTLLDLRNVGASAQIVVDEATFILHLEGVIDIEAERARLDKGKAAAEKERDGLAGRLSNPSFVERAKPEAVEKARADYAEKAAEAERLGAALTRLG